VDEHCFFIADFYCDERKLVIEVDGKIHDFQKEYDQGRTEILKEMGLSVIRFTNDEVSKDISAVLEKIRDAVS
jgi:very-short-patch-repair endonuclease